MSDLGWQSVGLLELTAIPSNGHARWKAWVRDADVLLADGGDACYLSYWVRQSGLTELLTTLQGTVWVGVSADSMIMTPRIGEEFVNWKSPGSGPAYAIDDQTAICVAGGSVRVVSEGRWQCFP